MRLAILALVAGCYGPVTTREEVIDACLVYLEAACQRRWECGGEPLDACLAGIRAECEADVLDEMRCWDEQIDAAHRCISDVAEVECSTICPNGACAPYTCRVGACR